METDWEWEQKGREVKTILSIASLWTVQIICSLNSGTASQRPNDNGGQHNNESVCVRMCV